jgi:flagellar basal-body rod protein FlgB
MLDKLFGGDGFVAITHALDAASLRHQVIANNLANVNTPGYKRQEVQFETQLSQALAQRDNPCAAATTPLSAIQPQIVTVGSTSQRSDGNNVDMETEMTNLAANSLDYQVLSQSITGYFMDLKAVIKGQ